MTLKKWSQLKIPHPVGIHVGQWCQLNFPDLFSSPSLIFVSSQKEHDRWLTTSQHQVSQRQLQLTADGILPPTAAEGPDC